MGDSTWPYEIIEKRTLKELAEAVNEKLLSKPQEFVLVGRPFKSFEDEEKVFYAQAVVYRAYS